MLLLISALTSWLVVWVLFPLLRRRLMDKPIARSSHQRPTPRGGGLVFVILTFIANTLALFNGLPVVESSSAVLFLVIPLAIVGFLDDCFNLSVVLRYAFQLATALLVILVSPLSPPWPLIPLLLFAVTAVINFTNFMDGLDGLVAGCMFVAISALAINLDAPWPFSTLAGSLLGFLVWNWSPAKVFMGDVGSTFLGAVFSGLVLQASSWPEAFGYLLLATPLLADACLCVPRRLLSGQRIFQAHRLHLFQRLNQAGWSHASVSLTYLIATALLAMAMLAGGLPWLLSLSVTELLIGVWLDQRVAVPFAVASKS